MVEVLWAAMRGSRERIAEVKESIFVGGSTLSDSVCSLIVVFLR